MTLSHQLHISWYKGRESTNTAWWLTVPGEPNTLLKLCQKGSRFVKKKKKKLFKIISIDFTETESIEG